MEIFGNNWTWLDFKLDLKDIYKTNYTRLFEDAKDSLISFTKQNFAWNHRVNIIKSFVISKFIFLARMLPVPIPEKDLQKWQSTLGNFVWNNKRH